MPTEHKLKTLPAYWDAVERGEKTFEVRRDDRGFQKGDVVVLQKYEIGYGYFPDPSQGKFSWLELRFTVGWILTGGQFGIEPGYVVFGLVPLGKRGPAA